MININLIAERRTKKVREMTIVRLSGLAIVLVFLVMLSMVGLAYLTLQSAQQKNIAYGNDLVIKKKQYAELQDIKQKIGELEPKVKLLKQVRVSEAAWMTVLRDITRVIPDTVVLDGITAGASDKGVVLHLTGRARDQEAVATFMENIRIQTQWADIPSTGTINSIQTDAGSGVSFEMSVPISGLVGGEL